MRLTTEDRLDIAELYARNAWALDIGDPDGFAATFAPDASLQMKQRYDGNAEIRHFAELFRENDFGYPRAQHIFSQLVIDGVEGDRCRSRAYVTRVHRLPGQHRGNCHVMWSGYCLDSCVKLGTRWLFHTRIMRAWEGDMAAAVAAIHQPTGQVTSRG